MKRFLLLSIENFIGKGRRFSQIYEMKITTFSNKRYLSNECYIKHPMQAVELSLTMKIDNNLHLINALDRSAHHAIIINYSYIPFAK